jgi:hypothetical protein
MKDTKQAESEMPRELIDRDVAHESVNRPAPIVELGRVSTDTHGLTGFRFEGFTMKP